MSSPDQETSHKHPNFEDWWKANKQAFLEQSNAKDCAQLAFKAGQADRAEIFDRLKRENVIAQVALGNSRPTILKDE